MMSSTTIIDPPAGRDALVEEYSRLLKMIETASVIISFIAVLAPMIAKVYVHLPNVALGFCGLTAMMIAVVCIGVSVCHFPVEGPLCGLEPQWSAGWLSLVFSISSAHMFVLAVSETDGCTCTLFWSTILSYVFWTCCFSYTFTHCTGHPKVQSWSHFSFLSLVDNFPVNDFLPLAVALFHMPGCWGVVKALWAFLPRIFPVLRWICLTIWALLPRIFLVLRWICSAIWAIPRGIFSALCWICLTIWAIPRGIFSVLRWICSTIWAIPRWIFSAIWALLVELFQSFAGLVQKFGHVGNASSHFLVHQLDMTVLEMRSQLIVIEMSSQLYMSIQR